MHMAGGTQMSTEHKGNRTSKKSDGFGSGWCKKRAKLIGGVSDSVQ